MGKKTPNLRDLTATLRTLAGQTARDQRKQLGLAAEDPATASSPASRSGQTGQSGSGSNTNGGATGAPANVSFRGVPAGVVGDEAADVADMEAIMATAWADYDAIMSASFYGSSAAESFGELSGAELRERLSAEEQSGGGPLTDAIEADPYCRWKARLAWQEVQAASDRTPAAELERSIVEPAVVWRDLVLAWSEAATVALAADAATMDPPASDMVLCMDARDGSRVAAERIDAPAWQPLAGQDGDEPTGAIQLRIFGLPSEYRTARVLVLGRDQISRVMASAGESPSEIAAPSIDQMEQADPSFAATLLARMTEAQPPIACPSFPVALQPYGAGTSLAWRSPELPTIRLRSDDAWIVLLS